MNLHDAGFRFMVRPDRKLSNWFLLPDERCHGWTDCTDMNDVEFENFIKGVDMGTYREEDIAFECGQHWVLKLKKGYEVYRIGVTHSTRVAIIGWPGNLGLGKAVDEAIRRESLRGFHIVAINDRTGARVQCTDTPLTHDEACVMLSKFTPHPQIRRILVETA